jgi:hypothetical protein
MVISESDSVKLEGGPQMLAASNFSEGWTLRGYFQSSCPII